MRVVVSGVGYYGCSLFLGTYTAEVPEQSLSSSGEATQARTKVRVHIFDPPFARPPSWARSSDFTGYLKSRCPGCSYIRHLHLYWTPLVAQ